MGIFVSVPKTVECILTALIFAVLLCFAAYKPLGVLQSAGYSNKKFFKWISKKGNLAQQRMCLLAMLCILSCAIISLCFSFTGEWSAVIGLIPFVLFFIVYTVADRKIALRSEVTRTARFTRLFVVLFVVCFIISYIFVTLLNFADCVWGNKIFTSLRYCALAILPATLFLLIALANLIAKIYEVPRNKKFVKSAKKKLAESNLKVIAITGSYGKTSTKFILNQILSGKYRVLSTPRSHNTPIGIALAINSHMLADYDIFVAEMGARNLGDIDELCEICPPDISVITGVCGQHLETFGTFANVVKAKGEILTHTQSCAVIADDCFDLFAEYPCKKERCGCVSDIDCSPAGVKFTLTLGGESRVCESKLLGRHAAFNIGIAAQAAYLAGMSLDEIAAAIPQIGYIEHRLQLIQNNGVNILDDGYNSNVKGARAALEVLRSFEGRKIAVTPGLVELGVLEEEENGELGKNLVGLDLVILVGDSLIEPVKKGYLENGGDKEKLVTVPSLNAAQQHIKEYIQSGDTVLFLNDLPDVV
ncbi:MAG: UDP-N-acetylmuramoyl-tripeptide--D-alanyl-D-alanine ligase [Clostridia bacterium]|nr:UDP-N-acetylmuramoyl-tripeptide--D-alanyl-D-alanine ligase [Clostridia bacterium]